MGFAITDACQKPRRGKHIPPRKTASGVAYTDLLAYYGYRLYDPMAGRWISRDPIAEKGGMNLYGSFMNDPVSNIDNLGKAVIWVGDLPTTTFDRDLIGKLNQRVGASSGQCAPWMKDAVGEIGVTENKGTKCDARIKQYIDSLPAGGGRNHMRANGMDNQSWCGCFAHWIMKNNGGSPLRGYDPIRAFSYGTVWSKSNYVFGAIVVFKHSHVGFLVGVTENDKIVVLGGNQRDRVQYRVYEKSQVKTLRYNTCSVCLKCPPLKVDIDTQKVIEEMNPDSNSNDR